MDDINTSRIFVLGFLGADRRGLANKIAAKLNYRVVDLDEEIEQEDGRSVQRICMMMGEHEYRNKEYEMLLKYAKMESIVVICGDGAMLDDMSRDILKQNTVIVADRELSAEDLWERSKHQKKVPYAFMQGPASSLMKEKFIALYEQRQPLYNQFISRPEEVFCDL